jgi:hypothetical protein
MCLEMVCRDESKLSAMAVGRHCLKCNQRKDRPAGGIGYGLKNVSS